MVLFGRIEDKGRNFRVDIVRRSGDGYNKLLMLDRVRAERRVLRAPLARGQLFIVEIARPSLQPKEGIYKDCGEK